MYSNLLGVHGYLKVTNDSLKTIFSKKFGATVALDLIRSICCSVLDKIWANHDRHVSRASPPRKTEWKPMVIGHHQQKQVAEVGGRCRGGR